MENKNHEVKCNLVSSGNTHILPLKALRFTTIIEVAVNICRVDRAVIVNNRGNLI